MSRKAYEHDYTWAIVSIVAAAALVAIFTIISASSPVDFSLDIDGNSYGAATTGGIDDINDQLQMGATKTYALAGIDYEVTLIFVSEGEESVLESAVFMVNGSLSSPLETGDSYEFGGVALTLGDLSITDCEALDCPYYYAEFTLVVSDNPPGNTVPPYVLIADSLREGQTKTYSIHDNEYEISTVFVSDPSSLPTKEVQFVVNGAVSPQLSEEEGFVMGARLYLQAKNILVNAREGVVNFWILSPWYAQSCDNGFTGENVFTEPGITACCDGTLSELPVCGQDEPETLECGDRTIVCEDGELVSYMTEAYVPPTVVCGGHGEPACTSGNACDSGLQECGDDVCWYCCADGTINGVCGTWSDSSACSSDSTNSRYDADCVVVVS